MPRGFIKIAALSQTYDMSLYMKKEHEYGGPDTDSDAATEIYQESE